MTSVADAARYRTAFANDAPFGSVVADVRAALARWDFGSH
jgi:hypothetical protein